MPAEVLCRGRDFVVSALGPGLQGLGGGAEQHGPVGKGQLLVAGVGALDPAFGLLLGVLGSRLCGNLCVLSLGLQTEAFRCVLAEAMFHLARVVGFF